MGQKTGHGLVQLCVAVDKVVVLAVGGNRWVASCQRARPAAEPAGEVRVALVSNEAASWIAEDCIAR